MATAQKSRSNKEPTCSSAECANATLYLFGGFKFAAPSGLFPLLVDLFLLPGFQQLATSESTGNIQREFRQMQRFEVDLLPGDGWAVNKCLEEAATSSADTQEEPVARR